MYKDIRTIFTFSSCNDVCLMDPDGQSLISGHLDNNVRIWDARSGVGIKELTGIHTGQITSVSMSPGKHTHKYAHRPFVVTHSNYRRNNITD